MPHTQMCWTTLEVAVRIWGGSGLAQRGGRVGTGAEQTLLFATLPPMAFKGKWECSWVLAACKILELDFSPSFQEPPHLSWFSGTMVPTQ